MISFFRYFWKKIAEWSRNFTELFEWKSELVIFFQDWELISNGYLENKKKETICYQSKL